MLSVILKLFIYSLIALCVTSLPTLTAPFLVLRVFSCISPNPSRKGNGFSKGSYSCLLMGNQIKKGNMKKYS